MPLRRMLLLAARHIAADPRVRAKAAEIIEREIRPRAERAWQSAQPRIDAVRSELAAIAAEADPRTEPRRFAALVKERFFAADKKR